MKHASLLPKKMKLLPGKQMFINAPIQSTKYSKKEMFNFQVDNTQEIIGDVYCPACWNEKCVYISINKTSSFYDC